MDEFPKKLGRKLSERKGANSFRSLQEPHELVDFSSNDYLGLAREDAVYSWAEQLVRELALPLNGATGARLLTGNNELFTRLEELLERVHKGSALVFNSGYDANIGFFSAVPQRTDLVFYDERVHASIRDGIRLGLAKSFKFRHNDLDDLADQWRRHVVTKRSPGKNPAFTSEVYVVTESVFSMDGDSPDLAGLLDFCGENQCRLVVDEAHAVGVCGPGGIGLVQHMGIHPKVFARIITFGKSMGCHGAAILGSRQLKEYLINFARSFIYTTAMPPHSLASLLASYHYIATGSGKQKHILLHKNISYFREQLALREMESYFTDSKSAIHCCQVKGNEEVKLASEHLRQSGFDVRPILSPTVAKGSERLRFCLHSYNTTSEIDRVLEGLAEFINAR